MQELGKAHRPIATLTLNPSIDITYTIDHLASDEKAHARHTRLDPGGNGVNVARGLRALGVHATACLVVAGEIGELLERLLRHHAGDLRIVRVKGETRINCTLIQANPPGQFEVDGIGPRLSEDTLDNVVGEFLDAVEDGLGVLAGSVPQGVPHQIYAAIMDRMKRNSAQAVVDTQGELLDRVLDRAPFLIKPNRHELETLCGRSLPKLTDVVDEAQKLHQRGIRHVCVSLGPEGAIWVDGGSAYHAVPPKVKVVSTVGAGDSMVAGIVAGNAFGWEPSETLTLAVACGTATSTKPGTEIFSGPEIMRLMPTVKVEKL